jgi:hypothetical protein
MDHTQVNHAENIRVNLAGIDLADARDGATATLSLLSEDTTHCDDCKEEITGLAVYFTRPRPDRRDGWEIVAVTCPGCGGYDGELA